MTMGDTIAIRIPKIVLEVQIADDEWLYLDDAGNVVGGRHTCTFPDLNAPKEIDTSAHTTDSPPAVS